MLKELIATYKEIKKKEWERKKLITNYWDVAFLQDAIQKVNKNPDLRVTMRWPDGRALELNTIQRPKKQTVSFNPIEEIDL